MAVLFYSVTCLLFYVAQCHQNIPGQVLMNQQDTVKVHHQQGNNQVPHQQQQHQQQQYQQPPPVQQNLNQQPPVQQQNLNQQPGGGQQQQQQIPHEQQQQHGQRFGDQNSIHDQEHIGQHLKNSVEVDTSKMTPEQLQFHYFKMHDTDGNNKLDGIELIHAITHVHDEANQDSPPPPRFKDEELEDMIDSIMKDDDFNDDGLIDYSEFLRSQHRGQEPPANPNP